MKTARTGKARTADGRIAVAATAVLAVGMGSSLIAASPAAAGSTGQQVWFNDGPAWGYATIYGANQNWQYVYSPSIYINGDGYGTLSNWWWQDWITITFYNSDGSKFGSRSCWVPSGLPTTDWNQCYRVFQSPPSGVS